MSDRNSSRCSDPSACSTAPPLRLLQTVLFAAPVVFAFLVLLLFCIIYFKRNSRSNINSQMRAHIFARQFLSAPDFDHGLSKSRRQNLPTIPFDESYVATHPDTQCAVCLGDYVLNEKLQQLPGCNHAFHVQCIDEWLSKNPTCPICRTSLLRQSRGDSFRLHQSANAGSFRLNQSSNAGGFEVLRREDIEPWEERVNTRPDACNGATTSSSEVASRINSEHLLSIERS